MVVIKTKPNKTVSEDFKSKIKTVFHHLTKEELVDKILANYIAENNIKTDKQVVVKKKKK